MDKKNIFVVGGSSGIGLEIVKKLRIDQNEIYVASRTSEFLSDYPDIHHLSTDITEEIPELDGLPDVVHGLVYCPGTIVLKPFQRLTMADFRNDLEINLLGAVKIIQSCLKRLKKSPTGASILLFSTVAVKVGMPFHASVASAKAAVEGLTRSLAAEFAPRIRVNAIAPSLTNTPLAESLLSNEERQKASAERHPLKRIGDPHEIAGFAQHLLSDEGSWITGQIFYIDGGMSSIRTFK
ncbi:MAG: SDR family oxidoreductase [Deltaproteobacteria bacterium]|jgi:NAD(P)-dependent dehydrogenase (short-subunit alcohol dehydrogenase family)|nr:SDR family oxidoreductase [Deltaproteobacteria bacterium]